MTSLFPSVESVGANLIQAFENLKISGLALAMKLFSRGVKGKIYPLLFVKSSLVTGVWRLWKHPSCIIWLGTSQKQKKARSNAEGELGYGKINVWLLLQRSLMEELGFLSKTPTPSYCDNRTTIQNASSTIYQERIKHIETNCYLIRRLLHLWNWSAATRYVH